MADERREKASDVFRKTDYPFVGKTTSFEKVFPEVADLRVEIVEEGETRYGAGYTPGLRTRVLTKSAGEFADCSNPLCYNGGFQLGTYLHAMVDARETEREFTVTCQGYEGSPKGRRRYRSCLNYFKVKVTVAYRPAEAGTP